MTLTVLVTILLCLIFVQGRTKVERLDFPKLNLTHFSVYANDLGNNGRRYNAWTCNYGEEPGYTCISCSEALHCYPGNFAILVQCGNLFSNCRNGYCSLFKTDGCNEEFMFADGTHGPLRLTTETVTTTLSAEESTYAGTTETVLDASTYSASDPNKVEEIVRPSEVVETDKKPTAEKEPRTS